MCQKLKQKENAINQSTKSRLQNSDGGDGHHLSTVYRNVFPQLTFEGSY